jgi:PAS domain S-box-containing protein
LLAEAHLSAIIQSSDDAIISKNLDGTIISWNPAATSIFGYTEEEMIGQSIRRLIPEEQQAEEDEIIRRIGRGERVKSFETIRQRKDGTTLRVALTVSPILDADGRIIGASKIARDVTDRHAAESARHESELRLRMLADNMSQLAWIARPDGTRIWYNKPWYDFTGFSDEGPVSGASDAHHPDHRERALEKYLACMASGREWEDTFPLRRADGQYRWFLSRAKPIFDGHGQITHWFGTATDVTDMLEKEEQIRVLLMEVNHRSKNMLAVVQALARRSGGADPAFLLRFENRLASLSANQDLLVRRGWASIPVGELVEAQLSILGRDSFPNVHASGPAINLSPRSAEVIGMALHELATNALKYGALSEGKGTIRLQWDETQARRFWIEWTESGGPPVLQPNGKGFGTTLIRHIPARSLDAEVALDFVATGLRWRLECDIETASGLTS